jgi:RNA polymerase sigma factor (sigma-70 family)
VAPIPLDEDLLDRCFRRADAQRWNLPRARWAETLESSVDRAFAGKSPSAREVERYVESLHLEDLALAGACAAGEDAAWEHFVREHRPALYRAADAIDHSGGARDLADSLYADLYGIEGGVDDRRSLFRYFHGRSSLATWLRAVLSQRYVDRVRAARRFEPLPDTDSAAAATRVAGLAEVPNPERPRYLALIQQALGLSLARLDARDRLRLGCYYSEGMTLAQIGKLVGEHEATVSRHLTRTRRTVRNEMERQLRQEGLSDAEIDECFRSVTDDPGPLDLKEVLSGAAARNPGEIVPDDVRASLPDGAAAASPGSKGERRGGRRA